MPEEHSGAPDRIDQLLGSLQESRTSQVPSNNSAGPSPTPRRRGKLWIVLLLAALVVAGGFLVLRGRKASLNVRSFPSDATVYIDSVEVGTTPLVVSGAAPGSHTIEIRMEGWEPWTGTVVAVRGSTTQVIANMTHAAYSLVVTSTPAGATVTIDGTVKGVTPLTVPGLKPRNYALTVSLKGYAPVTRTVDLSDPTETVQDFPLIQAYGKLDISSTPTGAEVIIDGTSAGVTPLKLDRFPVGDYSLVLKFEGSKDVTDTITVREGAICAKKYTLDLGLGGLTVVTDPPGAAITIDGQPTGQVTPYTFTALKEGTHEVYLELPGHLPWSTDVTILAAQTQQLSIALTKLE